MLKRKLNSLPATLESTYDQILTRIEEADAMNAMKLFLWLTFSEWPVDVYDLAIILQFDVEKQKFDVDAELYYADDVLKICSSLVTKNGYGTVQFAHASIKEYFQSNKRKIGSSVLVDPCFGHYFIGQCSLAYILQWRQVIPEQWHWPGDNPLLQYAALFWPKHILTCNQESAVMNQIINLFESQSLIDWVEAYHCQFGSLRMIYPIYLQIAALHGLIETAKHLMLQPVNSTECMDALYAAACNGHIDMVTLLLEKGNIKVAGKLYCEALKEVSKRGHHQVIKLLCEHGKGSDKFQEFINVAIINAFKSKQKEAIKLLLDCSGLNLKIYIADVRRAALHGDIELIQFMFEIESDEETKEKLIVVAVEMAAYCGHKDIVDLLLRLQKGLLETSASLRRLTHRKELVAKALSNAAKGGHKAIVEHLLQSGADMKATADAVVSALKQGHSHIVEALLLNTGIEVNMFGKEISHALCAAAYAGYEAQVRFLLHQGANPNIQGEDGQTPLHDASLNGNKNITQLLIDNGADVNAQGGEYGYPIWAAMSNGYNEIVNLLLQHGASLGVYSGYDGEALKAASKGGYRDIVEILLADGVDPNATRKNGDNALTSALRRGDKDIVKLLLENGAYINEYAVEDSCHIPLHVASEACKEDIVRILLEWGADVNIVGGYSGNALRAASQEGNKDIVQLLLEWGADVNIQWGSALIAASHGGHKPIVELLLKQGADVNLHDHHESALTAALTSCTSGCNEIAEILLLHGADVNFCHDTFGYPLTWAASCGDHDMAGMLLQYGADINIQSERDGSALYVAANDDGEKENNTKVVQLLLAHGAKYLGPIDDHYCCCNGWSW